MPASEDTWPPYSLPAQVWSVSQDRSQDTWLATLQPPSSSLVSLTGQESGHLAGHPTASQLKSGQSHRTGVRTPGWPPYSLPAQVWSVFQMYHDILHLVEDSQPGLVAHKILLSPQGSREAPCILLPFPPGVGPTAFNQGAGKHPEFPSPPTWGWPYRILVCGNTLQTKQRWQVF